MLTKRASGFIAIVGATVCLWPRLAPDAVAQPVSVADTNRKASSLLAPRGAWSSSVTYELDDLVTSRGSTWRSKHADNLGKIPGSTSPSTAADWEEFAAGLNPIGPWSGVSTYHRNDLVSHLGSTWRAKRTNTNKTPGLAPLDWQQFAAKGDIGPQGATGPRGATGLRGPTGENGPPGFINLSCSIGQMPVWGGSDWICYTVSACVLNGNCENGPP